MPGLSIKAAPNKIIQVYKKREGSDMEKFQSWSAVISPSYLSFLSFHFAVLTMLAFFLWSTVDLSSQAPHLHSAACRSKKNISSNCPFLSGKENFPRKPPAHFLWVPLTELSYLTMSQLWRGS